MRVSKVTPFYKGGSGGIKGFGVRQCAVLAAAAGLMMYVVFSYHGLVAGAIDHEICKTCHEKTYNEAMAKPFRHSVVDTKCGICHVGGKKESGGGAVSFSSSGLRRETLFPLKGFFRDKNDYSVEVTAANASGKRSRPVAVTFDGNAAPGLMETASALSISGIEVEEVKQGVFFEAAISWKTDSFADSALEYRTGGENSKTVSASLDYSKEHRVTLAPLEGGIEYYFRISARDVSGNTARSAEVGFSTAAPFKRGGEVKPSRRFPRVEEVKFLKSRNNEFYLLTSADVPSSFIVSVQERVRETQGDKHGSGLLAQKVSAIEACVNCHPQGTSHPVGVNARSKDTVIPRHLPTLSGGVIVCITCHLPHGGEQKYFARMNFQRDLCIECHRKDSFI